MAYNYCYLLYFISYGQLFIDKTFKLIIIIIIFI